MSVSLVCEHFSPTPAIEESVEKNVEMMTQKMPRIDDVSVYLAKAGHDFFSATMRVHAFGGRTLVSRALNPDLYTAIESATSKLMKQLRHLKTERLKKRRRPPNVLVELR
ncbi:MAG: HPF/RaiA family ribosome-associated protein [Bdellovibrionales bacterium]